MLDITYDRVAVTDYAHKWAYLRNPAYLDFSNLGGDCTNYASQCILAGSHDIMNYTPVLGWYYKTAQNRSPSWAGVEFLYRFLTTNRGAGPYAREVGIGEVEPGDIVQLAVNGGRYHHSPVIVEIDDYGRSRTLGDILVAAHSFDADYRPLATYNAEKIRFLHIEGVRGPGNADEQIHTPGYHNRDNILV